MDCGLYFRVLKPPSHHGIDHGAVNPARHLATIVCHQTRWQHLRCRLPHGLNGGGRNVMH
jgi:hypothetical protein